MRVWGIGVQLVTEMVRQATQPPAGQPGTGVSSVSSSSGSGSVSSVSSGSGSSGSSSSGPGMQEWLQVTTLLLQLLPRLAAALLSAVGDGGVPAAAEKNQGRYLAGWCVNFSITLSLGLNHCGEAAPAHSLATWVQAAAAGLRLQPLLARLDPGFRQLQDSATHRAAEHLSEQLMRVVSPALIGLSDAVQATGTAARSAGSVAGSGSAAGSDGGTGSGREADSSAADSGSEAGRSGAAGCWAAGSSGAAGSGAASSSAAGSGTLAIASLAADAALLHTQLCRLIHYLSSGGVVPNAVAWDNLLEAAEMSCRAAVQLGLPADG